MAQVFFDSDTPNVYDLNLTANEILAKHVSNEQVTDFGLFFNGRKVLNDQKLSDIKGLTAGKILRILNRKNSRVQAPSNLREQVVELDKRFEKFNALDDRNMTACLYNKNYIKQLIKDFPIILEEPILLNVLTDYSLLSAMLHEEVGFIQQHPSYVPILQKILADALPAAPEMMNLLRSALNPRRQRNVAENVPAVPTPARPLFTNQMLHDALRTANPFENSSSNGPAQSSTAEPPQPQAEAGLPEAAVPSPSVPVNRFAIQLAQLRDMGFTDDDTNIVILDSVDGNVEQATNLLFAMRD